MEIENSPDNSLDAKARYNKIALRRRAGSYVSVESKDLDFGYNEGKDDDIDVRQSYDDDPTGSPGGENTFPLDPASPSAQYPSISLSYSGSFDLDDDDDDYDDLARYNLTFSKTNGVASLAARNPGDGNSFVNGAGKFNWCSKVAGYLWFSLQSARQQARQRRAQLLLQQTERDWRQSLKICILTNCDATDSGILLVIVIMIAWILTWVFTGLGWGWILAGVIFFIVRIGARPLYHLFLRQRQKRHLYQQQNTDTGSVQEDDTFELHTIQRDTNVNGLTATSAGSDPTVAAI